MACELVLNRPDRERTEALCKDVYQFVFQLLDNELDLDSDDAGAIATAAEETVKEELVKALGVHRKV
jgi:hypothetical protein